MKYKLDYIFIIFSLLTTSCSSIGSNLKIERYEVESLNDDDFYIFIKKSEYENEQYASEKKEIITNCSKAMKAKGFNVASGSINESMTADFYARGVITVRTYHEIKQQPKFNELIFYVVFEKYNKKTNIINQIYGIKIKDQKDQFSSEVIQSFCSQVAELL